MEAVNEQRPATLRERFQSRTGRRYHEHEIEGIGLVVVKNMTAKEQIAFSSKFQKGTTDQDAMIAYVIECVHDETFQPVFTEADREWLGELDSPIMAALCQAVKEACGLGIGVKEQAKN